MNNSESGSPVNARATSPAVTVRAARDVRLIEEAGVVKAYPQPHRTPVLPPGWAPLSRQEQEAVLALCRVHRATLRLRLPSVWDPCVEYQAFELPRDSWNGMTVATMSVRRDEGDGPRPAHGQVNFRLLAISESPIEALRVAVDFFNWDLEAHGSTWRLFVATRDPR